MNTLKRELEKRKKDCHVETQFRWFSGNPKSLINEIPLDILNAKVKSCRKIVVNGETQWELYIEEVIG